MAILYLHVAVINGFSADIGIDGIATQYIYTFM